MSKLVFYNNFKLKPSARRAMLDNVEHLVIPAVAIREGVLNNIFYPSSELAEMVEAWNGVPVPVNHPMEGDVPITANATQVEEQFNIGRFYNVRFEDDAIKGEIWINIEKATRLGFADIVANLEKGEMMEVSTGLLAFTAKKKGRFENTEFDEVASGIRPDHLALLPNEQGACSIKDGCGAMRNNKEKDACGCSDDDDKMELNWFRRVLSNFFNPTMKPETKPLLVNALASRLGDTSSESIANLTAMSDSMLSNMAKGFKLNEDGTAIVEKVLDPAPAQPAKTETPVGSSISEDERALLNSLKSERDTRIANKRSQVVEMHNHIADASAFDETALDALLAVNASAPGAVNYGPAGVGAVPIANTGAPHKPKAVFLKEKAKPTE